MSAVTVQLTNICSGGNHLTFTVMGDAALTKVLDLPTLSDPLDSADVEAFLRVITRMAKMGRTVNQARTLLQNGVTVTV